MKARLPIWRRLAWRLGASFLLLAAVGIFVSGFLQYHAQERLIRESLGSLLLNIARTGALLVDGDLHHAVVAGGRKDTPDYERLRAQLARIQETNRLGDAVYTLTDVRGAMARFAVVSNGLVPVGLEYRLAPEIQPVLRRVLSEGVPGYTGIYRSTSGTWITAFAPVKTSAGQTVAALDVDFRADVYLAERAAARPAARGGGCRPGPRSRRAHGPSHHQARRRAGTARAGHRRGPIFRPGAGAGARR